MNEKWDGRFWDLARFVATWSKDPNAHVGAVITTKRGGAIALGYNGFPVGVEDSADRLNDKETKLEMVVHAEQNALLIAGPRAQGADLYCWGKTVCSRCAGLIIQSGITRVIAEDPEADKSSSWYQKGLLAIGMLREAKITVEFQKH